VGVESAFALLAQGLSFAGMTPRLLVLLALSCVLSSGLASRADRAAPATAPPRTVGNPVLPGWYADPEGVVFGDRYWIFATYSAPYDEQTFMDCFSSPSRLCSIVDRLRSMQP